VPTKTRHDATKPAAFIEKQGDERTEDASLARNVMQPGEVRAPSSVSAGPLPEESFE
jgi:hypothetical protein